MSSTVLYKVYKTKATADAEWHNSWLSAPLLWDYLCKRYISQDANWLFGNDKLWALASDPRVPVDLRLAHAFTFDGAVCPPSKLRRLSTALTNAGAVVSAETDKPSHWPSIARRLSILAATPNKRLAGVALTSTTVSDNWIEWAPSQREPWDIFGIVEPGEIPPPPVVALDGSGERG